MSSDLVIHWRGAAPENFSIGRGGKTVTGIVIHLMDGTEAGTAAWFGDPRSHVSSHYGVSKAGQLEQFVLEKNTAFHAGRRVRSTCQLVRSRPGLNPNSYTIGIEHEGFAADEWPDAQYQASAELIADICQRQSIPVDRAHIVMHREIQADKSCPDKCDIEKLVALASTILPTDS